jgi:hypothetical protein
MSKLMAEFDGQESEKFAGRARALDREVAGLLRPAT